MSTLDGSGCTITGKPSGSGSAKLRGMCATYAAQTTCPRSCPYYPKHDGKACECYAGNGTCKLHTDRLNLSTNDADTIARIEAALIDASTSELPLRIHVVGDCATVERAQCVSAAGMRYQDRTHETVHTYTHTWREIPRAAWGTINVLASCHTAEEVIEATALGYACALVVTHYPKARFPLPGGFTAVACPAIRKVIGGCAACKGLCRNDRRMIARREVVALEVHGGGKKYAAEHAYNPDTDSVRKGQTTMATTTAPRPIYVICREIRADWKRPYFGAVPYIEAMTHLDGINGTYGCDDAASIVRYFLSNATAWRGDVARRIKAELKAMLAGK